MDHIRRLHHLATTLSGLAGALLAFAAAAPAALARPGPPRPWQLQHHPLAARPPGWNKHPPLPPAHWTGPVHAVVIGGMPGWQIALIAVGAALAAATVAVLVDRGWAAHRKEGMSAA